MTDDHQIDPSIPCDAWDSRCEQFRRQRNELRTALELISTDAIPQGMSPKLFAERVLVNHPKPQQRGYLGSTPEELTMARDPVTNEEQIAYALADRLLDEPNCDPDDDLRVLARQLMRRHEEISRLRAALVPFGLAASHAEQRYAILEKAGVGIMDCMDSYVAQAKRYLSVRNFRDSVTALDETHGR